MKIRASRLHHVSTCTGLRIRVVQRVGAGAAGAAATTTSFSHSRSICTIFCKVSRFPAFSSRKIRARKQVLQFRRIHVVQSHIQQLRLQDRAGILECGKCFSMNIITEQPRVEGRHLTAVPRAGQDFCHSFSAQSTKYNPANAWLLSSSFASCARSQAKMHVLPHCPRVHDVR